MDDLTVCKRIAEIDMVHHEVDAYTGKVFVRDLDGNITINGRQYEVFNPLEDDALCFKLMNKYEMYLSTAYAEYDEHNKTYAVDTGRSVIFDRSPNRAVCRAIIETHKTNG